MARAKTRDLTHRPKDLCTLEQAAYFGREAARIEIALYERRQREQRPTRRLVRWWNRTLARLRQPREDA